jgi:hypothetical protein
METLDFLYPWMVLLMPMLAISFWRLRVFKEHQAEKHKRLTLFPGEEAMNLIRKHAEKNETTPESFAFASILTVVAAEEGRTEGWELMLVQKTQGGGMNIAALPPLIRKK